MVPSPSNTVDGSVLPADLAGVVAAWAHLPDAIKAGILAMVEAAQGPDA